MRVLILQEFTRIKRAGFNKVWETLEQDGVHWLQLEAQSDLNNAGIEYTIGEIEIKQEEIV